MFRIFLHMVFGMSCLMMMSCVGLPPSEGPELLPPLLVDNQDGTLTDTQNLLQWTKNDLTPGPVKCNAGTEKSIWYLGMYLDCLNKQRYLGYSDWRLPTYLELENLLETPETTTATLFSPQVLERLDGHQYWSTVDLAVYIQRRGLMLYNLIGPIYRYHQYARYYVWPVRSLNNKANIVASSAPE